MRRFDVLFHDHLPPVAAQPAAEESLDFADLLQIVQLYIPRQSGASTLGSSVRSLAAFFLSDAGPADARSAFGSSDAATSVRAALGARRQPPLLFERAQLRKCTLFPYSKRLKWCARHCRHRRLVNSMAIGGNWIETVVRAIDSHRRVLRDESTKTVTTTTATRRVWLEIRRSAAAAAAAWLAGR